MAAPLMILAAGLARRYGGCKPLAPVGPNGEAVIDLLASDAVRAGFTRIILVLHPETAPSLVYHVEQCWPAGLEVSFAEQRLPLGTVPAVLAGRQHLAQDQPFAVSNADDVYSEASMKLLADQLDSDLAEHILVGYQLAATVSTSDPVTRGICQVDDEGFLVALTERRQIVRRNHETVLRSDDGKEPVELDGHLPTSVNLWGFQPAVWELLDSAMARSGLDESALLAQASEGHALPKTEVLLPEVVADAVAEDARPPVRVILSDARVLGVTHSADLPIVSSEFARQVANGSRPARLWD